MSEIASGNKWSLQTEGTELVLDLSIDTDRQASSAGGNVKSVEYAFHDSAADRFPPEIVGFTSQTGWKIVQQPNGTVRLELGFKGKTYLIGMGPDNSPGILADFSV